jgi:hypothetical protein
VDDWVKNFYKVRILLAIVGPEKPAVKPQRGFRSATPQSLTTGKLGGADPNMKKNLETIINVVLGTPDTSTTASRALWNV